MTGAEMRMLVVEALRDPRRNAVRLVGLPLPGQALYEALVLVALLSTLALYVVSLLAGVSLVGDAPLPPPIVLAVLQIGVMLVLAGALRQLGRLFGGTGSFDGSLRIIIWLQFLMFLFQMVQLAAMLVLPPLAGLVSLVSLAAVFWLAAGLIAGLHGFRSMLLTLLGTLAGMVVVALLLSITLSLVVSLFFV